MHTKHIFTAVFALASAAFAGDTSFIPAQEHTIASLLHQEHASSALEDVQNHNYRNWKISLIPMIASQALDVSSSYGMRELNPLLANTHGQFGAKAAGIKLGTTAALLGVEYLIVKAHPGSARIF